MLHTIVGKRGRGKTSLAAEIIASQRRDQIFIYDYMAEFREFAIEGYIEVVNNAQNFSQFMVDLWTRSHGPLKDPETGKVTPGISTLVVLDEVAEYGNDPLHEDQIKTLYRLGRHKGIDCVAISQRFFSLPPIVRSQSDVFHCFQITEQRDLQYLRGIVAPPILETILHLDTFQYINLVL